MKKPRAEDDHARGVGDVKDRAVIVYTNYLKQHFKGVPIIVGGTEGTLRRFSHYDYWENRVRKPILIESRADLLVYGNGEKQILEIAQRLKDGKELHGILGTCEVVKELPEKTIILPTHQEVVDDKEAFNTLQKKFTNRLKLGQQIDTRFVLQHPFPHYTSKDLDEYYELPFTRKVPRTLRGFEFSIVTHRGCIGNCSFCALKLIQGEKIVSRSEESILREITALTKHPFFKGNIDDLGGPSANMYGMDCAINCMRNCIECDKLPHNNEKLIQLLRKARSIAGVKHIYIRSGVRYDLADESYIDELVKGEHIYETLRIAPEHVNKKQLQLMNKDRGDLKGFIKNFTKKYPDNKLSYYFITAHPGSSMKEAEELANYIKENNLVIDAQVFTPTPMTESTCQYHTGTDEKGNEIHIPYTYKEKKDQKRILTTTPA